jgi:hypothetical protein
MWIRVFGLNVNVPSSVSLCEMLYDNRFEVIPNVKGDDLGWTECQLNHSGVSIGLARYLTLEDDLRNDLNAYAAELESYQDIQHQAVDLMERVIQTKQLITIRKPLDHSNEVEMEANCIRIAEYFCGIVDGIYQIDGHGWFDLDGKILIREY